jgi:hypothetical protein
MGYLRSLREDEVSVTSLLDHTSPVHRPFCLRSVCQHTRIVDDRRGWWSLSA